MTFELEASRFIVMYVWDTRIAVSLVFVLLKRNANISPIVYGFMGLAFYGSSSKPDSKPKASETRCCCHRIPVDEA